ncbi:MAG: hypothetical protein ABI230_03380 [Aestuariivirga sp.]
MATLHPVLSTKLYQSIRVPLSDIMTLGPARDVPDDIVLQPGWILHELDFDLNQAVFLQQVQIKPIFAAPFAYQEQVSTARFAAMIPFADFIALAKRLNMPQRFIHLFNIGHCGSTLLHQVFNFSGAAQCISEPKFTFDLPTYRDKVEQPMLAALSAACLRFLTLLPGYDPSQPLVLKHFSQACRMIETWAQVTTNAVHLFLYRDAVSWANSRYGFVQRRGMPADITPENKWQRWQVMAVGAPESIADGIFDIASPNVRFDDFAAISWALFMQDFARVKASGIALHPFRYNELNKYRAEEMAKIFAVCDLPQDRLNAALAGFDKPAHEGTSSDRSKPARNLPDDSAAHITRLLSNPKLAVDPNLIV